MVDTGHSYRTSHNNLVKEHATLPLIPYAYSCSVQYDNNFNRVFAAATH
jgi:hypothetical protein